jgi:hypothetical protein
MGTVTIAAKTYYRLRIGKFSDKPEADSVSAQS